MKYSILDCDFYNFNETGFIIDIIYSKMIITNIERNSRSKAIQLGNREWIIMIIYSNEESETIPLFLIIQKQIYLSNWYIETDFPIDWIIKSISNK